MKRGLICSMIVLLLFSWVFANGAKAKESPQGSGGICFDENPNITLLEESISFNVKDPSFRAVANVIVDYKMHNNLDISQKFRMFFVVPPIDAGDSSKNFKVVLNGSDITQQAIYKQVALPQNWSPVIPEDFKEPYSGKVLAENELFKKGEVLAGSPENTMAGIEIPMEIKGVSTCNLKIEYVSESGYYNDHDYEKTIYSFVYFMTPAKYWNGEPKVHMELNFPNSSGYKFLSNISLRKRTPSSYQADLSKLPEKEWTITLVDKSFLIYGTNSTKVHSAITGFISICILFGFYYFSKQSKRPSWFSLGYAVSVIYMFCFIGKLGDSYENIFYKFILFIVFGFIVPIIYHFFKKAMQNSEVK